MHRNMAWLLFIGTLLVVVSPRGFSAEHGIHITGKVLEHAKEAPQYPWRIRFYDAFSGGRQVGDDFTGQTTINKENKFEITIQPPPELAQHKSLWLEMHVNIYGKPITDDDLVGVRMKVQRSNFHAGFMGIILVNWPDYQEDPANFNAGAKQSRFDVKDFGAVGDGINDDTSAIQAAIDAARPQGGEVYIPVGTYKVSSLNATNLYTGVAIRGVAGPYMASRLLPSKSDVNVLDLSGSVYMNIENLHIGPYPQLGQAGSFDPNIPIPKTAIMLAQVPDFRSNAFHFDSVFVNGKFSVAAFYCYGVPSSSMVNCDIWNMNPAEDSSVVIFTRENIAKIKSDFTKLYDKPHGGFAGTNTSDWTISGCEIHDIANFWTLGGRTPTRAVLLNNTMQMRWIGGNISSGGREFMRMRGENLWITIVGTTFYSDFGPSPDAAIYNEGKLRSFSLGNSQITSEPIFKSDPGAIFDELQLNTSLVGKTLIDAPGAVISNSVIQCGGLDLRAASISDSLLVHPGAIEGKLSKVLNTNDQ